MVIFTHIPKTAGTLFATGVISPNHSREDVYDWSGYDSVDLARLARAKVITGHSRYGIHRLIPRRVRYCTFLREPIDRVISYYYFVRRSKFANYEHPDWQRANEQSLVEFCAVPTMRNLQTRTLAGSVLSRLSSHFADGWVGRYALACATRHMRDSYEVGLTEHYSESVERLTQVFGWDHRSAGNPNVNPDRPATPPSESVREALARYNALDVQLYRHATARFASQAR